MQIRPATAADMPQLLQIYAAARAFMAAHGNPNQWVDGYPGGALLRAEIQRGVCYLCEEDGIAVGSFCYIPGDEPTYAVIEDGAWPDNKPYATIHRLAANGRVPGVGAACIGWCAAQGLPLRIDTHADNTVMQRMLGKNVFVYCGRIYLANGSPRLAYYRPQN